MLTIVAVPGKKGSFGCVGPFIPGEMRFQAVALPALGTLRACAEWVLTVLETEPRPRVLLGHGVGGSVALELAQFAPGAADALILHAPVGASVGRRPLRRALVGRDWFESLRPVSIPAALLWGERDRILPVDQTAAFRPLLPGAVVSLPGRWGHFPMIEQPEDYAREIIALARKLLG